PGYSSRFSLYPRCPYCTRRKTKTGSVARMSAAISRIQQARVPDFAALIRATSRLSVSLAHPRLDLGHAADPAVVVFGLLPHVIEHLRMRQDHKRLLLDALQRILRHLFR